MAPVGLPLLLGARRRVFQQRKQEVQSFPGRNELGLFRKSPGWLDEREGEGIDMAPQRWVAARSRGAPGPC